ncbi:radical SAM protein [Actinoalloteichus fjordicus]|nr:radical SAM protein [Actinoalloteichus fjordicus]
MVIWELTRYCNLACLHCCTDSDPQVSRERDLALPEIRRAIEEMLAVGVVEFFFSGGEPMSRPDFPEIVEAVDSERADVFVNTNGYHLTPALAQRLAGTAMRRVTVSIDGADRATHAVLRGKPASYDRAVDAVSAALGAGLAVRVSHVVAAPNVAGVEEFVSRMVEVGVDNIVVNTVFPAGRAVRNPHLHLTSEQLVDVERRLVDLREKCRKDGVELDFSMGEPDKEDVPAGCPAGDQVLYVAPDGSVSGCSWLAKLDPARFTVGNLHRTSFAAMSGDLAGQNLLFAEHRSCPLPTLAQRR